jgi:extracellular factor (EF) 3-hydroxypalmitic acid methyl ester biosynthesis protein
MTDIVVSEKAKSFFRFSDGMATFLKGVKEECTVLDVPSISEKEKVSFLEQKRHHFFKRTDDFFEKTWGLIQEVPEEEKQICREYYIKALYPYIWKDCEFNEYIRAKPLGYDGDFVMMTYIYDYHDKYFGKTLHSKLINKYTCNVDVSRSNLARKEFFKKEISDRVKKNSYSRILSVGCGPAREVVELLREGSLTNEIDFFCLDFEDRAIAFVKEQLASVKYDSKKIRIHFIKVDLIALVRNHIPEAQISDCDMIYISGVFDYLSSRICKRVVQYFFDRLVPQGQLIIANMSFTKAKHRAYYEFLGDWNMNHRHLHDLVEWTDSIKSPHRHELIDVPNCPSYHYIRIIKP